MFSPNIVLIAMRTTEVGVETFSLILNITSCHRRSNGYRATEPACLNRRERTEKEQISTPLPAMALKIPPRNPTNRSTTACHQPKFTMESNVFLLCSLQKQKAHVRKCPKKYLQIQVTCLKGKEQTQS